MIVFFVDKSLQNFAHDTTVWLSCHVQNFLVIIVSEFGWKTNEISIYLGDNGKTLVEWAPALWEECQDKQDD